MRRMTAGGPGRRTVLAGGAALLLSACLPGGDDAAPAAAVRAIRQRARLAQESRGLSARYAAAARQFPEARAELGALAGEHDAHAAALLPPTAARWLRQVAPPAAATAPAATPPTAPPATPAPPGALPSSLTAAQQVLAGAERAAGRRRATAARTAEPGLARLLASISACHAVHADLLAGPT